MSEQRKAHAARLQRIKDLSKKLYQARWRWLMAWRERRNGHSKHAHRPKGTSADERMSGGSSGWLAHVLYWWGAVGVVGLAGFCVWGSLLITRADPLWFRLYVLLCATVIPLGIAVRYFIVTPRPWRLQRRPAVGRYDNPPQPETFTPCDCPDRPGMYQSAEPVVAVPCDHKPPFRLNPG